MNSSIASRASAVTTQAGKRIVVVDQTAPGGATATGALKETYFSSIPAERLLIVHQTGLGDRNTLLAGHKISFSNMRVYRGIDRPLALIRAFRPNIMVYRPLPTAPDLHRLACTLALQDGIPFLLWFMDDWPERLRAANPAEADAIEHDLRRLAERATGCFAISESMASAFRERYGGPPYQVAHNGIRPEDWSFPDTPRPESEQVLLRYSGSLAPDMTLDSITSLAQAVSDLVTQGSPVRLEIRTQEYWFRQYKHSFKGLRGVSIAAARGSQDEYRRWIAGADIGIVAYNFDEETIRYTRYSFANKVPELMAAGSAVLAIGPTEIETVRYLRDNGVAAVADRPEALPGVLQDLLSDSGKRRALAVAAQEHASQLTLDAVRQEMAAFLNGPGNTDRRAPDAISLIRTAPPAFVWRTLDWLLLKVRRTKWALDDLWRLVARTTKAPPPATLRPEGHRDGK